eukprot:gene19507-26176_t
MAGTGDWGVGALRSLDRNAIMLFTSRFVRLFSFGCCGVVLAVFLHEVGIPDNKMGLLLTLTILGDSFICLGLSLWADRIGRRVMLLVGSTLALVGASLFFFFSHGEGNFWILVVAATVGVISPSGNEVGPFMALEQSILSDLVPAADRTMVFAWYGMIGYLASALGALSTGFFTRWMMEHWGMTPLDSYRLIFVEYGGCAILVAIIVLNLSSNVEARKVPEQLELANQGWREEDGGLLPSDKDRSTGTKESAFLIKPTFLALQLEVKNVEEQQECVNRGWKEEDGELLPSDKYRSTGSEESAFLIKPTFLALQLEVKNVKEQQECVKRGWKEKADDPSDEDRGGGSTVVRGASNITVLDCKPPTLDYKLPTLKDWVDPNDKAPGSGDVNSGIHEEPCAAGEGPAAWKGACDRTGEQDIPQGVRAQSEVVPSLAGSSPTPCFSTLSTFSDVGHLLNSNPKTAVLAGEEQCKPGECECEQPGLRPALALVPPSLGEDEQPLLAPYHSSNPMLTASPKASAPQPEWLLKGACGPYKVARLGSDSSVHILVLDAPGSGNGTRGTRDDWGSSGGESPRFWGLRESTLRTVFTLSALFALDAFGASLVTGTLLAYFFQVQFGMPIDFLGSVLFGSFLLAGLSSLLAGHVANKIGLVNTMVFTHLPSNIFLILVPLMPNVNLAATMVLLRSVIGQMDVVPRQSYVSGVVPADERTAALGITNVLRSLGTAAGPIVTGYLASREMFHIAFYLSGAIMIVYDLSLLYCFRNLKASHETKG